MVNQEPQIVINKTWAEHKQDQENERLRRALAQRRLTKGVLYFISAIILIFIVVVLMKTRPDILIGLISLIVVIVILIIVIYI